MSKTMMYVSALALTAFVAASCSKQAEEVHEVQQGIQNIRSTAASVDRATQAHSTALERAASRKGRGDTIPLPGATLAGMIPASIEGYKVEKTDTVTTSAMGFSMSNVSRRYEAGRKFVKITITDYNGSMDTFTGLAAAFNIQTHLESNSKIEGTFQTKNLLVAGSERYDKQSKDCMVQYGVGARFHIIMESNAKTIDELKAIAAGMDLEKLSAM